MLLARNDYWPMSYADLQATPEIVVRMLPILRKLMKRYAAKVPNG